MVVVQARMGSSRLPGKSLRSLRGWPLIWHVLERAAAIPGTCGVVLATSDHIRDDALAATVAPLGVPVIRGPELDVLDRVRTAAEAASATRVIRVTGDCPLLDPTIAARLLDLWTLPLPPCYAWNDTARSGWPDGTDVEVFDRELLETAHREARSVEDREHVTLWLRRHYPVVTLDSSGDWSGLKLSVDTQADLDRVSAIYDRLPVHQFTLAHTLAAAARAGVL